MLGRLTSGTVLPPMGCRLQQVLPADDCYAAIYPPCPQMSTQAFVCFVYIPCFPSSFFGFSRFIVLRCCELDLALMAITTPDLWSRATVCPSPTSWPTFSQHIVNFDQFDVFSSQVPERLSSSWMLDIVGPIVYGRPHREAILPPAVPAGGALPTS